MTPTRLNLLVLRTCQLEALKAFYATLGIEFVTERHGGGTSHYAGYVGSLLLELYPLPEGSTQPDATTRLGFVVPDVDAVLQTVESAGGNVVSRPQQTQWGLRAVVRDPDGRAVELYGQDSS
jgi:predicted enzyme related to lactoylglutathione lyase